MIVSTLFVGAIALQACLSPVEGSNAASLLARPPRRTRAGFIVNDQPAPGSVESPTASSGSPSFVSVGIRSSCAREKAATARSKNQSGATAATRLRGGSWGSTPFVPQVLNDKDKPPEQPIASNSLDSCTNRESQSAQYATSNQRVLEEPEETAEVENESSREASIAGGAGGARVGALPGFPRTLPAGGKTAVTKKFAWVP